MHQRSNTILFILAKFPQEFLEMKSITALLVAALFSIVSAKSFDWQFANTSVWLSAAAYCETNTYMTRTFKGYSTGFKVTNVIDDKAQDVQVSFMEAFVIIEFVL